MIRLAVMYPNLADENFDFTYYQESHIPLVQKTYQPLGLVSVEVDIALELSGKNAAPYLAVAYLTFQNKETLFAAIKHSGHIINADIKQYTSITPLIQISKSITY